MVDAGYFERLVRPPAWAMSFEPTISPMRACRLGATADILYFKNSERVSRKEMSSVTRSAHFLICSAS